MKYQLLINSKIRKTYNQEFSNFKDALKVYNQIVLCGAETASLIRFNKQTEVYCPSFVYNLFHKTIIHAWKPIKDGLK